MARVVNKYKAITGCLPRRYELSQWNEKHYLQFFEMCSYFMVGDNLRFPASKILMLEKEILEGLPSFKQEVLFRVNEFSTDPNATHRKFSLRFNTFLRLIGRFLKLNPSLVTEEMRKVMEPNPRLNWMIKQFKDYETKTGEVITVPDTRDLTNPGKTLHTAKPDSLPTQMMNITANIVNTLVLVSKSIKKSDLSSLSVKDKFQIMKLGIDGVATIVKSGQKTGGMAINININQAGREELEAELLNFSRSQT